MKNYLADFMEFRSWLNYMLAASHRYIQDVDYVRSETKKSRTMILYT